MPYKFETKMLRVLNNQASNDIQAKMLHENWTDFFDGFTTLPDKQVGEAFMELFRFTEGVEQFNNLNEIAKRFSAIALPQDASKLKQLFKRSGEVSSAVGFWLVSCMRTINRITHSPQHLEAFKNLFDKLNIPVEGPWEKCVLARSFKEVNYEVDSLGKGKVVVAI